MTKHGGKHNPKINDNPELYPEQLNGLSTARHIIYIKGLTNANTTDSPLFPLLIGWWYAQ